MGGGYVSYNTVTLDENGEVKKILEEYIETSPRIDGKIYFSNITEMPKQYYNLSDYNSKYYDWRYFKVSFYYDDCDNGDFSGNYTWSAYVVKENAEASWRVESMGYP